MILRQQLPATLGAAYRIERELGGGGVSTVFLPRTSPSSGKTWSESVASLAAGVNTDRFRRAYDRLHRE